MESRLYVGNLSYELNEGDLRSLFEQAGLVQSVTIIKDHFTGHSKGFGYVEMSNQEEAIRAINMFHHREVCGRALKVNLALPKERHIPRGGGSGDRNRGPFDY
jgi:cold-inducible RNA-binding protein